MRVGTGGEKLTEVKDKYKLYFPAQEFHSNVPSDVGDFDLAFV